ncbi:MAG: transglutaminase-like domain-containing protein [Planctomycetota bacterium]|nr:transglutaminase-like domain-containing protein [Planctomycetota bacterium]
MPHAKCPIETRWTPAPRTAEQRAFVDAFDFEPAGEPRLAELRARHALEQVVAPGRDELERLRLLSDWTYERFRKFGRPSLKTEDALEILEACAAGHTFYCAHYAIVMCAAATALGWHARVLSLRRADYPDRVSNHNIVELWSGTLGKWVLWDPTLNFCLEAGGTLLNAYEAARAWFGPERENLRFLIGPDATPRAPGELPIRYRHYEGFGWQALAERGVSSFACLAYVPSNRLLGTYRERTIEHWDEWPGIHVVETAKTAWAADAAALEPYYPLCRVEG